jgi:hypothetical protein
LRELSELGPSQLAGGGLKISALHLGISSREWPEAAACLRPLRDTNASADATADRREGGPASAPQGRSVVPGGTLGQVWRRSEAERERSDRFDRPVPNRAVT